jgi:AcrR family transcriptional regulator
MSPRSAQANERMRVESRERILAAALEVFAEKGHDATISDVTARAGVSRGLITYYFPGKRDLVEALLTRYLEGLLQVVNVSGSADERLAAMIDGILGFAFRTLPVQRAMLSLMIHPTTHPLFGQVEAVLSKQLEQFETILRQVFADRGAADPALEEVMFRSTVEGVIFKASVYPDKYPREQVRRRVHELYGLPAPQTTITDGEPVPAGRMRVRPDLA